MNKEIEILIDYFCNCHKGYENCKQIYNCKYRLKKIGKILNLNYGLNLLIFIKKNIILSMILITQAMRTSRQMYYSWQYGTLKR